MLKHTLLRLLALGMQLSLGLAIVLIPTNLNLDMAKQSALVNGVLVDYLLPKLYLTDLMFAASLGFALLIALLTPRASLSGIRAITRRIPWLFPLFLLSLVASVSTSVAPLAGWWYLWRLTVLCWAIYAFSTKLTLRQFRPWLMVAILFQSLVGITQWIQKSSLIGYLFFGETELSVRSTVATTSWFGEMRPLPYGTTAHPNILAGFLAVGLVILLLIPALESKRAWWHSFLRTLGSLLFVIISLTALALTQSVSGLIALCVGVIASWTTGTRSLRLFAFGGMVLGLSLFTVPMVDNLSVSRRLDLLEFSLEMFKDHPYLGVGPNNFTAVMPSYGEIPGPIRFYQPVHTIYALALTEIGLVGLTLYGLVIWQIVRRFPLSTLVHPGIIPLSQVMIIGIFDHYPLSLQTGQLIMAMAIAVAIHWGRSRQIALAQSVDQGKKKPAPRKSTAKKARKTTTRNNKNN